MFCGGCSFTEAEPLIVNEVGEFCSEDCHVLHLKRLGRKPKIAKTCGTCEQSFETARDLQIYCSTDCRLEGQRKMSTARIRLKFETLYPGGIKTKICRWCNEEMKVSARKSYAGRLYHEDCSREAQAARYRIKTVKRQKKTNPQRISPEQVVREYGSNCNICSEPIDLELPRTHRFGLTVDHHIPVNKGGTDDMSNLRPAHWICNVKKSDKMPETDNA